MSSFINPNEISNIKSKQANLESDSLNDELPPSSQEEVHEVATQLAQVRKHHDKTKESNQKKKLYLENLKKDLEKSTKIVLLAENDRKAAQNKFEYLKQDLEISRRKYEEELATKRSYLHVLDRMKSQQIGLELKSNQLQKSLKQAKQVLYTENEKFRKTREINFQSRLTLQDITEEASIDKKKQDLKLSLRKKNLKLRKEAAERREERERKKTLIAEAAAVDDKESYETKLREAIFVHRLWYSLLVKKHETEMQNALKIEEAFRKIKATTGMTDVKEIVHNFLTKEETYNNLQKAVTKAEENLEHLRNHNKLAKEQIQGIYFDDKNNKRQKYYEIDTMEHKLEVLHKEYLLEREKVERSSKIYDQILTWSDKMMKVLEIENEIELVPAYNLTENTESLTEAFEIMSEKLEIVAGPISENRDSGREAVEEYNKKEADELIAEIIGEDPLKKLVRVRTVKELGSEDLTLRGDENERMRGSFKLDKTIQ